MGVADLEGCHVAAFAKYLKCISLKLYKSRVNLFIYRLRISFSYRAAYGDDRLTVYILKHTVIVYDNLGHSRVIPKIDKKHATVIADGIHPAGKLYLLADVLVTYVIAVMRSVHTNLLKVRQGDGSSVSFCKT